MARRLDEFRSLDHLHEMPVAQAREVNDREAVVMFGPVEQVATVRDVTIAGSIPVRIYEPAPPARGSLVYFHGGGWVVGSLASHDGVARHLCRHGGGTVMAVDYRLAPEHPFPAAVDDAWAAMQWAHRELAPPLAVGGDSSGGGLAAVMARRARDTGIALALHLLVYPSLDLSAAGGLDGYWTRSYLGGRQDAARDPDASPLLASNLDGLAPACLVSCAMDSLWAQAVRYEARLSESGVPVEHSVYPDLIHGAYRMPAVVSGARAMLDDSAAALSHALRLK